MPDTRYGILQPYFQWYGGKRVKKLFGTGKDRVCAVVAATTSKEMAAQVAEALRETSTVELRLDWLKSDQERRDFLTWLKNNKPERAVFMATCRRVPGGGKFKGSIPEQLRWLAQAREAGCLWCDVEVESLMELKDNSVRQYAVPRRILLSAHDFEGTPPLEQIDIEKHSVVDAMKVAAKAQTITDSVRLLWVAKRSKKIVAVPMGDVGLPARILALREGSALAYAPVGEATAPGQISLREMLHLYRAHQLGSKTRVYGVIGNPVGHSLSPLMHNTGFIVAAKDAVYLPFLVHDLEDFLRVIHPLGIRGFSVTIPHKQTIMKYLNRCSPLAEKIGAVNTVMVRANGELCGANTDMEGVLWALRHKLSFQGTRVLIFGAGGAARAAAFGLANYQVNVAICARREQLASDLARDVNGEALPRRALLTESFDAIVNATPVGMCPHTGVSPLTERELNCRLVMDMIYRPQQTELLKIAERIGIATVSGAEMFLAQGFAQWDVWADRPHRKGERPDDAMRKAVMDALNAEESRAAGNNRSRA